MHRRVFMTTVGLAMLGAVAFAQDVTYDISQAAEKLFKNYPPKQKELP